MCFSTVTFDIKDSINVGLTNMRYEIDEIAGQFGWESNFLWSKSVKRTCLHILSSLLNISYSSRVNWSMLMLRLGPIYPGLIVIRRST